MKFSNEKIKEILLEEGYAKEEDIKKAEEYSKEHRTSFLDYLLSENLISESIIGQAIAESFKVPYLDLQSAQIPKEQVQKIPEELAKKMHCALYSINDTEAIVVTDDPSQKDLMEELSKIFPGVEIKIAYSLTEDIEELFVNYQKGFEIYLEKIIKEKGNVATEISEQIFKSALQLNVSDIHFEPEEKYVVIRFRIDGVLHDVGVIEKEYYENIVNLIKVQAKLRIDEHMSSQDGALRYKTEGMEPVDFRIAIAPTLNGEKIAIRVLASYINIKNLNLTNIGLPENLQKQIIKSSKKPFGMILVTGPTGSGKSTTLYSLIKIINTRQINITTIEDPVEYKIDGITQIQVNAQTNLTFAKGLRSITRQDPNIILVGEIRDTETADIAVNAALTGHLMLSTFHANDAVSAIPRLIDMGIEPYLLSSTLELIISQRLLRRICESCKTSYSISEAKLKKMNLELLKYFDEKSLVLYKGKGCETCSHTGYRGRVGVFEYFTISSDLQDLIPKNSTTKDIFNLVRKEGFETIFEDGVKKVKDGVTTIEELLRVLSPQ